jgi:thiamine-phosphate pyrophosphorylase
MRAPVAEKRNILQMLLYYITERSAFPGGEANRRRQLVAKIAEAAGAGVDYIQLREKDLAGGELETLGREAVRAVREANPKTKLLLNSRTDVALSIGADGVHLRAEDILPREAAAIRQKAARNSGLQTREWLSGVSCHSVENVRRAEAEGGSFAVLGPIFGKQTATTVHALGLEPLEIACRGKLPVLALGGVTLENARACMAAGAAGIAAIRLFQNGPTEEVIRQLRSL